MKQTACFSFISIMFEETKKCVIFIDNYFILLKFCQISRYYTIGVVDDVIFRPEQAGSNVKAVEEKHTRFNGFVRDVDHFGTLILGWIDDGFVVLVKIVHTIKDISSRGRKRAKVTAKHKSHIQ